MGIASLHPSYAPIASVSCWNPISRLRRPDVKLAISKQSTSPDRRRPVVVPVEAAGSLPISGRAAATFAARSGDVLATALSRENLVCQFVKWPLDPSRVESRGQFSFVDVVGADDRFAEVLSAHRIIQA